MTYLEKFSNIFYHFKDVIFKQERFDTTNVLTAFLYDPGQALSWLSEILVLDKMIVKT